MKMVALPILLVVMLAVTGGLPGAKAANVTNPPTEDTTDPGSESVVEEETTNDDGIGNDEEPMTEPPAGEGEHQVAKRATRCPCGWSRCGNRCFRYFSMACPWYKAQRFCQARGANLASVHSLHEELFVRRLALNRLAWIGLSDAQQERYWFWIDGTRVNYNNWARRQPDNYRGNQDCLQINWGSQRRWDDDNCRAPRSFVCVRNR